MTDSIAPAAQGADTTPPPKSYSPDFNLFLKLLTTQMQNQDPLNPMNTSEYTAQLAQYTQVEQSIQQTASIKALLDKMNADDLVNAAGYIGREVQFGSPVSGLGDKPARWAFVCKAVPASIEAVIKDSQNRIVRTFKVDPSDKGMVSWDGSLADGGKADKGAYSLELRALDDKGQVLDAGVASVGVVEEVATVEGKVVLTVNGLPFSLDLVEGVHGKVADPTKA
ncbi:flagellar hook assembly protein FlgD [Sphingomonas morindae]|uniref:Basal-body rod modification protein FlgD n=1 Tax=Sphingomonas morindae TaxID=1541170 RepID=A0ABY4X8R0_9SPHN|nr:flagellar hook capping FlgD N-terminal domain-containing protein [Sphingomonas morindae]USI73263.1 flagellar hook assembly protein FlgD [Sphingomonas morindae]